MTIEEIEIRKVVMQLLADAGINRETLKDLVKQTVSEKVEQAIKTAYFQMNIDKKVDSKWDEFIRNEIADAARHAIYKKINPYFTNVSVILDFGNHEKTDYGSKHITKNVEREQYNG